MSLQTASYLLRLGTAASSKRGIMKKVSEISHSLLS